MRRHLLYAGILWVVLTAIGEIAVIAFDRYPLAAAEEAHLIDEAFQVLLYMSMPVFAFVIAAMVYSVLRFRATPDDGDGPFMPGARSVAYGWLGVTTALTIVVIIYPGLWGLFELRDNDPEMVIEVEAQQWNWKVTYPDAGVEIKKARDLVLPVDTQIEFVITARDVLHSFWIPAFRTKIDAVPGIETSLVVTPDMTGDGDVDFNFRVQCAELCGTGHARMRMNVEVLEQEEFDAWLAGRQSVSSINQTAKGAGG